MTRQIFAALAAFAAVACAADLPAAEASASASAIKIDCAYPGGNVKVRAIDEASGTVEISPDLRDTKGKWFYFDFTVRGAAGRTLHFRFPKGKYPYLSTLGPAISRDGGATWRWLRADGSRHLPVNAFDYSFAPGERETRFAFCIPYTQKDWDAAAPRWRAKGGVESGVLCKSQSGRRDTEMMRIPCRKGKGRLLVVFTARHHACEASASPVMEGIIDEVLSGSPEGEWLRDNADMVFVPFVDKDGVEDGDQGKNRAPFDHNRDYATGRYTSVRALRELIEKESAGRKFVAFDLHSPFSRSFPPREPEQEAAFTFRYEESVQGALIDAFRRNWAETSKNGALVYHGRYDIKPNVGHAAAMERDRKKGRMSFRQWTRVRPECLMSVCCEFGYSLCGGVYSREGARELGANLLKALSRTLSAE